jgi:TonB-dependent receptor
MKTLYTFLLIIFSGSLFAQNGTVSGIIIDDEVLGMPGATIEIPAAGLRTVSLGKGDFRLVNVPVGKHEIVVTYIGYKISKTTVAVEEAKTAFVRIMLEEETSIGEMVVVMGDRLKGQSKALSQQRNNMNITNIVAADQIGRFPDANIGDAMKRIPGITMQNDQGEARDIIIRGMAPQLNSVMLNGERIPSAEGDNRRIQMDLIPSDMIQTIEVNKAVLPDMDADAIGGAVNLITRNAPEGERISGTLASGVNLLSGKPIWTGAGIYGNRFLNNKLGMVISASYNNHRFGSDNVEAVWVDTDAGVVLDEFDIRKYQVQRVRRSLTAALDYRINKNHTLIFSSMYNWRDDWENRFRMRVGQLEDAFNDGNFTEKAPGQFEVSRARVEFQTKGGLDNNRIKAARLEDQRMYNFTVGGNHQFNKLIATWNLTTAKASEERPNERYVSFRQSRQVVNVDVSDPMKPLSILANSADNLNIGFNELTENYNYTTDKDLNGRIDFILPYAKQSTLKFGGRFRTKDKDRNNNFFEYEPLSPFGNLGSVPNRNESDPNFLAGKQYQVGYFATPEWLGGLNLKNPNEFEETDLPEEYAAANYTADEDIYATYLMANHTFNAKFSAVAGLRYEATRISYTGNIFDIDEETVKSDSRTNSYSNFMPGLHLRYAPEKNTVLRGAWTNTIARPNYFDLVPYALFSPQDQELERGNPDLIATTAMNFDLMAERYFKNVGLVSAGLFYKNIDDFIYTQTLQNFSDPVFGDDLQFTTPKNGGTAEVYGIELSFQKQIWKGLGVFTNYTYTQSSTTGIEGREEDDLSLPGTAEHMFNASISYETKKLVLRVSLNHASGYIDELGGENFEDRFYDRQTFLDVNASYAFTPNLRFFAEGNNLTNQPLRFYQGIRERTMQMEYYNARFNFGIKFDMFRKK